MPIQPTYPGVYIQEVPSGVRTITGVSTSITAFVGRTKKGPIDDPALVSSFGEFTRVFGGLWDKSTLSYAVRDFFGNGGGQALVVRVFAARGDAAPATSGDSTDAALASLSDSIDAASVRIDDRDKTDEAKAAIESILRDGAELLTSLAGSASADAIENLRAKLKDLEEKSKDEKFLSTTASRKGAKTSLDDIKAALAAAQPANPGASEATPSAPPGVAQGTVMSSVGSITARASSPGEWSNGLRIRVSTLGYDAQPGRFSLSVLPPKKAPNQTPLERFVNLSLTDEQRRVDRVIARESGLITVAAYDAGAAVTGGGDPSEPEGTLAGGDDGAVPTGETLLGSEADKTGLYALEKADIFNLLCIPPPTRDSDTPSAVYSKAHEYAKKRRAILLIDPQRSWGSAAQAKARFGDTGVQGAQATNAALYFPLLRSVDPERGGSLEDFVPCGMVAGAIARTDMQRGIWKAPAGLEAALNGSQGLSVSLTDDEQGQLNPLGINCFRSFPTAGRVIWGSRTLAGADQLASEWKYLPVRRLALYIEESLFRGTQWIVFEPNDEPLWAQIRLNVGAFMHDLFRKGAFQGGSPKDAYFVKCDGETTLQNDIDRGIVNIQVGFAPLKPAEFVVISIQQIAGAIAA